MKNDQHNTSNIKRIRFESDETGNKKRKPKQKRSKQQDYYYATGTKFLCACTGKACEGVCREANLKHGSCPSAYVID